MWEFQNKRGTTVLQKCTSYMYIENKHIHAMCAAYTTFGRIDI
jgi:hypothetical protein